MGLAALQLAALSPKRTSNTVRHYFKTPVQSLGWPRGHRYEPKVNILIAFRCVFWFTAALADNHKKIIDAVQAKEMHDRGVLFVDVRSKFSFERGHIPGALSVKMYAAKISSQNSRRLSKKIRISCSIAVGSTALDQVEAILIVHPLGYRQFVPSEGRLSGLERSWLPGDRIERHSRS